MTWLAVKIFLEKAYAWCVQHWRWLAFGLVALVAYLSGRKSAKNLWMKAELARKQDKAEALAIEKAHALKDKKIEKIEKDFKSKLNLAEKEKDLSEKDLSEKIKKETTILANDPKAIDAALKDAGISEV